MEKLPENSEIERECASDYFGGLRRLPPATFRGIECSLLADQYRRARALEATEGHLLHEDAHP